MYGLCWILALTEREPWTLKEMIKTISYSMLTFISNIIYKAWKY